MRMSTNSTIAHTNVTAKPMQQNAVPATVTASITMPSPV